MGETEGLRRMTVGEMWAQALLRLMPDDYPTSNSSWRRSAMLPPPPPPRPRIAPKPTERMDEPPPATPDHWCEPPCCWKANLWPWHRCKGEKVMGKEAPRDALGLAICKALGIESRRIFRIELEIEAGRSPIITFQRWLLPEEDAGTGTTLERYKLVSLEEEADDGPE